jgi:hypothetical protein
MALNLENDEVLSAAIEGLPKIVELIASVPEAKRSLALAAAQQSYLQTAQALGYEESDAERWASTVMSLLEITSLAGERATGVPEGDASQITRQMLPLESHRDLGISQRFATVAAVKREPTNWP